MLARKKTTVMFILLGVLVVFSTACGGADKTSSYPNRNIEIVVGWGAGGGTDLFTRTLSEPIKDILSTSITVVNIPGAGSAEATNYIQEQEADGYTLFAVTSDILTNAALGRSKYGPEDFIPIIRAHVDVGMLHVSTDSPFESWDDLVQFGKENPKKLSVGGVGAVGTDEVITQTIVKQAGIEISYVPFEEAGQMHASLLGGHIDVMYEEPGPAISLIEAGEVRPLIVAADERLEAFSDVPSVGELGYDIPPYLWRGIVVKKGTPEEIVKILEKAYKEAYDSDEYREFESERMLDLMPGYMDSETFAEDLKREYEIYSSVLEEMGY